MSLKIEIIPIFENNYVFVIVDPISSEAVVVDPGEAQPVAHYLKNNNLNLKAIFLTHHHSDHIDGVLELCDLLGLENLPIYAPLVNQAQIKQANHFIQQGLVLQLLNHDWQVLELPGHTLGHIAYYNNKLNILFSGDVLFGLGTGRLFEGTPRQMWDSLNIIKKLPAQTQVYCTHEYTEMNCKFTEKLLNEEEFSNLIDINLLDVYRRNLISLRSNNQPSVPLLLSDELSCNLYLNSNSIEQMARIRSLRNNF